MDENILSSGVQELIDRLRQDGVNAGQNEADTRIAAAEKQARQIVEQARKEAESLKAKAAKEADRFRHNAQEALQIAARDTLLELQSNLSRRFNQRIAGMLSETMRDAEFLQKVILEIAGKMREEIHEQEKLEVLLPSEISGLDELRRSPEKLKEEALGRFALSVAEEMFREGVTIKSGFHKNGLRIVLLERKLQIDLDEKTIGALLAQHLLPRFRALLEGSIR